MLINLAISIATSNEYRPIVLIPNARSGPLTQLLEEHAIEWHDTPPLNWFIWANTEKTSEYLMGVSEVAAIYEDVLRRIGADMVVINTLTHLEGVIAAVRANLPYLLWVHGILDAGMIGRYEYLVKMSEDIPLKLARQVVCCSKWTRAFFEYKVPGEKLHAVHNWTNVPVAPTRRNAQARFSALSTLEPHKGIDIMINAVAILRGRNVALDVYGDGSDRSRYEQMVSRLKLTDRIRFHGRVTDVDRVYDQSRAVIFPSFIEPFGMVAIEAMARGTPIIASRTGGLCEIIQDGVHGLLCTPGDAEDLAIQMRRVMDEPELVASLSHHGFERARADFDGSKALERFTHILNNVHAGFVSYSSEQLGLLDMLDLVLKPAEKPASVLWPAASSDTFQDDGDKDHPHTPAYSEQDIAHLGNPSLRQLGASDQELQAALRSRLEELSEGRFIKGWANLASIDEPCDLEAFIDGSFAGRFRADLPREDLVLANVPEQRAFLFPVPAAYQDGQAHLFEIRLAGTEINLSNSPATFTSRRLRINAAGPQETCPDSNLEELLLGKALKGWVSSLTEDIPVIEAYADGGFLGRFRAEQERPDVVAAGFAKGRGFIFQIPEPLLDGAEHLLDVRLSNGQPLNNSPRVFTTSLVIPEAPRLASPSLESWASRTFGSLGAGADPTPRSWRKAKTAGSHPFLIAIADAVIPSSEILLEQPLSELRRIYGIDYQLYLEGTQPLQENIERADVLLFQRTISSSAIETALLAERRGIPIVYLLDDDLESLGPDAGLSREMTRLRSKNIRAMFRIARRVAVFSQAMHDEIAQSVAHVNRLPLSADLEFYRRLPPIAESIGRLGEHRIGFAGTTTHGGDVRLIENALHSLLDSRPQLVVESIGQVIKSLEGHPRYRAFPEVEGVRNFGIFLRSRGWTVGLAPLAPTSFNEKKTDNKYRVYAAVGIAGAYSDLAPYRENVVDGKTGMLVRDSGWQDAIVRLLDDPKLRAGIVRNARHDLGERYSLAAVASEYHRLLTRLLDTPSVVLVSSRPTSRLRGLGELDRRRLIHLRRTSIRTFSPDHLSRADVIVFEMESADMYHPLVSTARESGCRIITAVHLGSENSPTLTSLPRQNAILRDSDMLLAYDTPIGENRRAGLMIRKVLSLAPSDIPGNNWHENLTALARNPELLGWSARDVEVVNRSLTTADDEVDLWIDALTHLGLPCSEEQTRSLTSEGTA